jgi:hypothetical protein
LFGNRFENIDRTGHGSNICHAIYMRKGICRGPSNGPIGAILMT